MSACDLFSRYCKYKEALLPSLKNCFVFLFNLKFLMLPVSIVLLSKRSTNIVMLLVHADEMDVR